jgi:diguanylate cyclase (GGDEF)-like protein
LNELEEGASFALHWIDLDRFKEVNDGLGHPVGDALLKSVAKRLRNIVREPDIVARLGGDEFALIQTGIATPAQAARLANRIVKSISEPHYILGHDVSVGASVGVALAPRDGTTADDLIKRADVALYEAKQAGRGTYRIFEASHNHDARPGRSLEADLKGALGRGELELYFQPILDVKTQTITSFEALIRWKHPGQGMIPPGEFIPIAEETGLIVPIGTWVLNEACQQAASWSKDVKVTVNLSPIQFEHGDLYEVVADALHRSGLPANRLELEITEGLLLRDSYAINELLHKLRSLGISISLDDFGTAYASLSYLRSFPFDKIKIDRSFMREADHPERADCVAIINAVAGLARQLQMGTVAEGVETAEHVNTALVAGCDQVQGFYFSRPVPAAEVEKLLAQEKPIGEAGGRAPAN